MPQVIDNRGLYPSDLTEAQWERIKDLVPRARRGGRPRSTDIRQVINGVLYLVNTGCPWRYLPKNFPPCKTVYHYFRAWIFSGAWRSIHDALTRSTRRELG